ncbi:hypothetical protein [Mesorhizobium sp.]|uniref:hypothetical protein n=1 Tax=Mesorhizobium sp. TaxID=1871066 RepID=UPI000FE4C2C9|nr:hypothetical protein [Mesorhizobium sp.]RWK03294.1 MAG: hypothetical protein EOR39_29830 [Mesorhizobium sp.]
MHFPQVLTGMFTTAAIVWTWVYLASGSFWKAVAWAIVTLIVVQLGYFVMVVRLVYKLERKDAFGIPKKNEKSRSDLPGEVGQAQERRSFRS